MATNSTLRIARAATREPFTVLSEVVRFIIISWPNSGFGLQLRRLYFSRAGVTAGANAYFGRGFRVNLPHLLTVGNNSGFADDVEIVLGPGEKRCLVGNNSWIGPGTYIRSMNHRFDRLDIPISTQGHNGDDITIGDDVWTGARCILLAGAKIGDHSVIAAGSVVSSPIPARSIAGGNPARVILRRKEATP